MSRQQTKGALRPPPANAGRAAPRRRDWLRWGSLALAVVGAIDSAYLTWVKLAGLTPFCGSSHACDTVNTSIYSEFAGIPIAVLGLGAYLLLAGLLLLEDRLPVVSAWGPVTVFGLALTGSLYSVYLTYVELYILHAVCPYCVVSAVCIVGILVLAILRLVRGSGGELDD
jgi:uncharacterized membrane protein